MPGGQDEGRSCTAYSKKWPASGQSGHSLLATSETRTFQLFCICASAWQCMSLAKQIQPCSADPQVKAHQCLNC